MNWSGRNDKGRQFRQIMKVGLFGGTFDPIHIGHLILADESLSQLALSRLYFVLTPYPPHKNNENVSDLEKRLEMLHSAIDDNPNFSLSRVDIDRSPPHYAVDTVKILKQGYSELEICYLMGGDSLHDLPTWHNPQEFVDICDSICVMRRPNDQIDMDALEGIIPGIKNKIHYIQGPLLEISGTKIRQYIKEAGPYRYYLPVDVYRIVERYGLYR